VDWIHRAQDRDHWYAFVNTVMNLQVRSSLAERLSAFQTGLLHGVSSLFHYSVRPLLSCMLDAIKQRHWQSDNSPLHVPSTRHELLLLPLSLRCHSNRSRNVSRMQKKGNKSIDWNIQNIGRLEAMSFHMRTPKLNACQEQGGGELLHGPTRVPAGVEAGPARINWPELIRDEQNSEHFRNTCICLLRYPSVVNVSVLQYTALLGS